MKTEPSLQPLNRRTRLRRGAALFAAAFAFASALGVAGGADESGVYPVSLFHPAKAGEKYELAVTASEKIRNAKTETGKAAQVEQRSVTLQLDAAVEVLAVDHEGRQTKLAVTVRKFSRSGDNAGTVLPDGAVVTADLPDGGGPHFALKGGPLSPQQSTELALALEAHKPGPTTAGDLFGNARPQKVGASWPVDAAKEAADASRNGVAVGREHVKGQAKLAAARKVDGKDCVEVTAETTAAGFRAPMPPGVTQEKATLEGRFTGVFPTDPAVRSYTETTDLKYDAKGKERKTEPAAPAPKGSKKKPAPKQVEIDADVSMEIHREARVTGPRATTQP